MLTRIQGHPGHVDHHVGTVSSHHELLVLHARLKLQVAAMTAFFLIDVDNIAIVFLHFIGKRCQMLTKRVFMLVAAGGAYKFLI